ncbi:MAG: hypothetical protein ABI196_06825, partial [Bradyrhizobium sp.]
PERPAVGGVFCSSLVGGCLRSWILSVFRPLSLVQKFPFLAGFHSAQNNGLLPASQIPARDTGTGMMPVKWSLRTDGCFVLA